MCKHNTAGSHCQHCAPLYNDRPWEAADGRTGAPNECRSKYQPPLFKSLLCGRHLSVNSLLSLETQYKVVDDRSYTQTSPYHCPARLQPLETVSSQPIGLSGQECAVYSLGSLRDLKAVLENLTVIQTRVDTRATKGCSVPWLS